MTQKGFFWLPGLLLALLTVHAIQPASGQTWRVISHTMAKGIDEFNGRPTGNTTRFLTTDEKAVCWFEIEVDGFGPLTLTWRWMEPSGTPYREHAPVEQVPSRGIYRFWDFIGVRNTPVEVKLGMWTIEVFVRTQKLFLTSFLVESPPTLYSIQVKANGFEKKFSTSLYVDGIKIGGILGGETKDLSFKIGTVHTLTVDEYVEGGNDVRFHCSANSLAVREEIFHSFFYETEYYLRVTSEHGSKGEGWYKAGSKASFSVSTPVAEGWGTRYLFKQWAGDWTGESNAGSILMDGPKKVTALWVVDYSQLYLNVAAAVGIGVAIVAVTLVAQKKRRFRPIERGIQTSSVRNCVGCGRQMLYVERVKRYYCTYCKKYE
ncbi:hypothetical protein MUP05_08635 [Candidatus Bathyarchaeota archaeon]|nr:hypothetical protein [Candidatus Bathyarchaeota archaeon]